MREFAPIQLSLATDQAFRELSPAAQHLYFVCLTDPSMSYCGVMDWRPKRVRQRAAGWSIGEVEAAASELIDGLYIVVDEDTDECLVRSFLRNDGLLKQPKMGVSAARAYREVASTGILGVLTDELHRLRDEQPELKGLATAEWDRAWKNSRVAAADFPCGNPYAEPAGNPTVSPSVNPSDNPSVYPSVKGKSMGTGDPSVYPPDNPSVYPPPRTGNREQRTGEPRARTRGDDQEAVGEAESTPSPDSSAEVDGALDALAAAAPEEVGQSGTPADWSTADDPRCVVHAGLPRAEVPACHGCGQARLWFEDHSRAGARQRQAAIDACDFCDDRGMANHGTDNAPVLGKCDHSGPPMPWEPEPEPEPDFDPAMFIQKVSRNKSGPTRRTESPETGEQSASGGEPIPHDSDAANGHTEPERKTA